ncbi:MAG: T9SS type A sorting domain-containing protein [Bacteroidota bacterium]
MRAVCFILLFFFSFLNVSAQTTFWGDVTLSTQGQIDSFSINYPGITKVAGRLTLQEQRSGAITNLQGLNQLETMGYFTVEGLDSLKDFTGLEQLTTVEFEMRVEDNDALSSLLGLNLLTEIAGGLVIKSDSNLVSLEGLEGLQGIGNKIELQHNPRLKSLAGFVNLESAFGSFQIIDNDSLESLAGLELLSYVGTDLSITGNARLNSLAGLRQLKTVRQTLSITFLPLLTSLEGLSSLERVNEELYITHCPLLTDMTALEQSPLRIGSLTISANDSLRHLPRLHHTRTLRNLIITENPVLQDLSGLDSLQTISSLLGIMHNFQLNSLKGLEALRTIGGNLGLIENGNLTSISALKQLESVTVELLIDGENITSLEGLENLREVGNLNIRNCPQLTDLRSLSGLVSIDSRMQIVNNAALQNLNGLGNLAAVRFINIENNPLLERLVELDQLNPADVIAVTITNNPMLSVCNTRFLCQYITDNGQYTIDGNATGCGSREEVLAGCTGFSPVYFFIFRDDNENKQFDGTEQIYPNGRIRLSPSETVHFSDADDGGVLYLLEGDYRMELDIAALPDWQLTTDSLSYAFQIDLAGATTIDTFYFGLRPTVEKSEGISSISSARTRCNTSVPFDLYFKNTGTTFLPSGILWLETDPGIDSIDFLQNPDTTVGAHVYGWKFTNLFPGFSFSQTAYVGIPGPPQIGLGDQLRFEAYTSFRDDNGSYQSPPFVYTPEIRCSYDPNDKLVNPQRENNYTLFEETLLYTIRFQNTGNDVAFDVLIRDTLDELLDPSTFELLGTSHPEQLQTIFEDDRHLIFQFDNIFLPDSTSDLEGSQGYVSFAIRPFEGLPEQTPVHNTASIYFDLNPPIVTNTTQNILVSELVSTFELAKGGELHIFPNPTTNWLHLQSTPTSTGQLQLLDATGRLLLQQAFTGGAQRLDLSRYSSGLYFLHINIGKQRIAAKVIKQ